MKNNKVLPLVALISGLLVGCGGGGGGGGGGGTPAINYQWQIVDLYKDDRSDIPAGCAIIDNVSDGSGQVIASKVAETSYRILFHNSDGTIDSTKTIEGSNIPSTGIIKFRDVDVPEDGYVSLEEFVGAKNGERESYIFSVQKKLLQNLTLAIQTTQFSGSACYKGDQKPEDLTNGDAVIAVTANSNPQYYQTSASSAKSAGGTQPVGLAVISGLPALETKLVTAFSDYTSNEQNNLTQYAIVPLGNVYDSTTPPSPPLVSVLDDRNVVQHAFSATDIALSDSGVEVVLDGNVYQWQPIFDSSTTYSIANDEEQLTLWSARLEGTSSALTGSWLYSALKPLDGADLSVVAPNLTDFSTSSIGNCGSSYCVNVAGFSEDNYQVQRTSIRSNSDSNKPYYQTIYSAPTQTQVVLESASELIAPQASDVIEVGLVDSEADTLDSAKFIMAASMDPENTLSGGSAAYFDSIGVIQLPTEFLTQKKAMMGHTYQALSNKVN